MEKIFYLAQVLDSLRAIAIVLLIFASVTCFISIMVYITDGYYEDDDCFKKAFWISLIISIIACLTIIFVPAKESYLLMNAGKAVDNAISNNPKIKELPENTLLLLNEYINAKTEAVKSEQK